MDNPSGGMYVVSVNTLTTNHEWCGLTDFYFDTLNEASDFINYEADKLIPIAYKHINDIVLFEVALWDDTIDEFEALEVKMIEPIADKE